RTALPFRSRSNVSSTLLRATASTNSGCSAVRFPGKVVWAIAGRIFASNWVKLPSSASAIAPLTAPHAECPRTAITFAPDLRRELHAAEHVRTLHVARDPTVEDVTQALVEDDLGRRARVDAPEHHRFRPLPPRGPLQLHQKVAVLLLAGTESLVPGFQPRDDLVRVEGIPGSFGQRLDHVIGCRRRPRSVGRQTVPPT